MLISLLFIVMLLFTMHVLFIRLYDLFILFYTTNDTKCYRTIDNAVKQTAGCLCKVTARDKYCETAGIMQPNAADRTASFRNNHRGDQTIEITG